MARLAYLKKNSPILKQYEEKAIRLTGYFDWMDGNFPAGALKTQILLALKKSNTELNDKLELLNLQYNWDVATRTSKVKLSFVDKPNMNESLSTIGKYMNQIRLDPPYDVSLIGVIPDRSTYNKQVINLEVSWRRAQSITQK